MSAISKASFCRYRASCARGTALGLFVTLFIGIHLGAEAFFPTGEFDAFGLFTLYKWSPAQMFPDVYGDVGGPGTGIKIMLEGPPVGFTNDEIAIVKDAFQVWQNVPTAAVGFQFIGQTQDPVLPVPDLVNLLTITSAGGAGDVGLSSVEAGLTLITVATDQYGLSMGGLGIQYSEGDVIEADMVINGDMVRPSSAGLAPVVDLKAVLVHEIGHFLGLAHTPLNNLEELTGTSALAGLSGLLLAESQAICWRDATGVLAPTGATPTMFPVYFLTDDGTGNYKPGQADLAPDDIAGVSYLYPRGSQDCFFSLAQEARTQDTNPNLPSLPNPGAHIVAWCDADNDPNTTRVPLFSTLSGLYSYQPLLSGQFTIYNLLKQMEYVGVTGPFTATYTFTLSQLNGMGLARQAPPAYTTLDFTSITNGAPLTPVISTYTSETFNEDGNVFDVADYDVGTPLAWSDARGLVYSVTSDKSLDTILPSLKPMFGETSPVCPMNLIFSNGGTPTGTPTTPTTPTTGLLRKLRDDVLLRTTIGSAMVETYYRMAPAMARYLVHHASLLSGLRAMARGVDWMCLHTASLVLAMLGVIAALFAMFFRRRFWLVAGVFLALAFLAPTADALTPVLSDDDMVRLSDDIVQGTIASVNSLWVQEGTHQAIFTDIAITVSDNIKGPQNKDSQIFIRQPGGQMGGIATLVPELPTFKVGQEVILYLEHNAKVGLVLLAGNRGRVDVTTNAATGQKKIVASSTEAQLALKSFGASQDTTKAKSIAPNPKGDPVPPAIPLDQYKEYLRSLVKAQSKKK